MHQLIDNNISIIYLRIQMNVVVIASASRTGGALSIYLQFLNHLETEIGAGHYYIFVDPKMPCRKIDGVEYIPINTSGIARFLFDINGFKIIIRKRRICPDVIFSLQNTAVFCDDVPQLVYYHQSLPFFKCKFNLLTSTGRTYIFYHYLYPLYVKLLHNRNVKYIVQTDYIKKCFSKKYSSVSRDDVYSFFPDVEDVAICNVVDYAYEKDTYNFVYPALAADYKEHETLVYALKKLEEKETDVFNKVRIHFTFTENSYPHLSNLISNLHLEKNFVFHGRIDHEILLSMVKSSHGLLFPSVIETIGLPMLEAAAMGVPVVANDLPFVHSVIDDYEGATFVKLHDYEQWAQTILSLCYRLEHFHELSMNRSTWPDVFRLITSLGKRR